MATIVKKQKVDTPKYNDYLTHEPGDDDIMDVEESFQLIHQAIDEIYKENGIIK